MMLSNLKTLNTCTTWWILGNATRRNDVIAPTLGIVFTDGISKNPTETKKEAELLRDIGTKVYSVGISFKINDEELLDISGDPSRVIKIRTFKELKKRLNSFVTLVCPKCPIATPIKNAVVPLSEFIVETKITYFCRPKYRPIGNPAIECQLNQTWTPTDFACKADCKEPPEVERSTVSYDDTIEGYKAIYTCAQSTFPEGNFTRVCQENFEWSPVNFYCRPDCGPPPDIVRATISTGNNLEGTTRTYTCAEWTVPQGNPSIICQNNGQWSSTDLYCRPDCGIPMDIPRAQLLPGQLLEGVTIGGGTLEGDIRRYKCLPNTVMEGNPTIECLVDGTWSITNLYCRPDCGPPPNVQYATYVIERKRIWFKVYSYLVSHVFLFVSLGQLVRISTKYDIQKPRS
nr:P-U4 [Pinctada fucata]